MRVLGQGEDGRIVIDGEGEVVHVTDPVPMLNPASLMHFNFINDMVEVVDTQGDFDFLFNRIDAVMGFIQRDLRESFGNDVMIAHIGVVSRLCNHTERLRLLLSELREALRETKTSSFQTKNDCDGGDIISDCGPY